MKVFASWRTPSPPPATQLTKGTAVDAADFSEAAVVRYRDAIKQHKKAVKELYTCTESFTRALGAVAASFSKLAADAHVPAVVQSSGALVQGLEEVVDGVLLQDLLEELDYACGTRYEALALEQRALEEHRQRKRKVEKAFAAQQAQCEKTRVKNDADAKALAVHQAELLKRGELEVDCTRTRADFEDAYHEYARRLGRIVQEDMTDVMEELHKVLSALSYQHRKCEENLRASMPKGKVLSVAG